MSDKITKLTSTKKEELKNKTVLALPDNPSNKGLSAEQIKAKMAEPSLWLFEALKNLAQETSDTFDIYDENIDETVREAGEKYLGSKVDKTTNKNKVYATNNDGEQTEYGIDYGTNYGGSVVRRSGADEQIYVPLTPTQNGHAASKKYIDDLIITVKKNSFKEADYTTYETLNDFLATTGEEGYMYLYPKDTSDLTKGYYLYIYEVDEENETASWVYLGDTSLDLTPYVDLTSNQTISGVKTFSPKTYFNAGIDVGVNKVNFGDAMYIQNSGGNYMVLAQNSSQRMAVGSAIYSYVDFLPGSSGQKNLGSSAMNWNDLYLSGNVYFGGTTHYITKDGSNMKFECDGNSFSFRGNIIPGANGSYNLGASDKKWGTIYLQGLHTSGGNLSMQVGDHIEIYSNNGADFFPHTDNYVSLGQATKRFSTLFVSAIRNNYSALQIETSTSLNIKCGTNGAVVPSADNSFDVGSVTAKWKDLYLAGNLSDGTNTVKVSEIAKKADPSAPITVGTFDSNGEVTVAIADLPDGVYMLTYAYAQAILYVNETQITTATTYGCPIRAPMPVVYAGYPNWYSVAGNLRIQKSGTNYKIKVSDGNLHAYDGAELFAIKIGIV